MIDFLHNEVVYIFHLEPTAVHTIHHVKCLTACHKLNCMRCTFIYFPNLLLQIVKKELQTVMRNHDTMAYTY